MFHGLCGIGCSMSTFLEQHYSDDCYKKKNINKTSCVTTAVKLRSCQGIAYVV